MTSNKVDYIVLHKLPNGEALDLQNMQTYTMDDLETEIGKSIKINKPTPPTARRPLSKSNATTEYQSNGLDDDDGQV